MIDLIYRKYRGKKKKKKKKGFNFFKLKDDIRQVFSYFVRRQCL